MKYNFLYKKPGIKSFEHILSLNSLSPIRDFCCVKDGLFIVEDNRSYLIKTNNEIKTETLGFQNIRSVCSFHNEIYCLTSNGGNIINLTSGETWLKGIEKNKFAKYFENIKEYNGQIYTDGTYMTVSIEELNKCFILEKSGLYKSVGNGKRDYCLATNLLESGISMPKGIVLLNDEFLVSDYGNGCVRRFSGLDTKVMHSVILGNPKDKNIKANKIFTINKTLYYNSNNTIYQCSISGENLNTYYKDDSLRNMSISHDGTKIIMMLEI